MDFLDTGPGKGILLLVHGFPLDRHIWDAQVKALTGRVRVVAPDLPGLGTSPLGDAPPGSLDDYARALLELMNGLGAVQFAVAGHSMGGGILFALHRQAPDRVSGIGLVSTRSAPDSPDARAAREETARRVGEEGVGFLVEPSVERLVAPDATDEVRESIRAIIRKADPAGVAAAARALGARPDATPQLAGISCPAVVIAGRHDRIVPPAESEAMAGAIPGARLVWAERSGHVPMMEEPALVTEALAPLA